MGERSFLSIGDVLSLLKKDFPDVTISKIRFLESQGLLDPERTASGYRKFYDEDVERLRWILRQQREHFLPLKVIKGRLEGTIPGGADDSQGQLDLGLNSGASRPASTGSDTVRRERSGTPGRGSGPTQDAPAPRSGGGGSGDTVPASVAGGTAGSTGSTRPTEKRSSRTGVALPGPETGVAASTPAAQRAEVSDAVFVQLASPPPGSDAGPAAKAAAPRPQTGSRDSAPPPTRVHPPSPEPTGRPSSGSEAGGDPGPAAQSTGAPPRAGAIREAGHRTPAVPERQTEPAPAAVATGGSAPSASAEPITPDRGDDRPPPQRVTSRPVPSPPQRGPGGPTAARRTVGENQGDDPDGLRAAREALGLSPRRSGSTGRSPSAPPPPSAPGNPTSLAAAAAPVTRSSQPAAQPRASYPPPPSGAHLNMTTAELASASGLPVDTVEDLVRYGLVEGRVAAGTTYFEEDALHVARLAAGFLEHGFEPRHIRMYRLAAEREVGLFEQVVVPILRQRNPEARKQARLAVSELAKLGQQMRSAMVRAALRSIDKR